MVHNLHHKETSKQDLIIILNKGFATVNFDRFGFSGIKTVIPVLTLFHIRFSCQKISFIDVLMYISFIQYYIQ